MEYSFVKKFIFMLLIIGMLMNLPLPVLAAEAGGETESMEDIILESDKSDPEERAIKADDAEEILEELDEKMDGILQKAIDWISGVIKRVFGLVEEFIEETIT